MNRYRALLKVVEVGSYTHAAEILGYTQPALSQMIASLEREIGITLLYRSRYGVRPTPEGEQLLPTIRKTVQQYDDKHQSLPFSPCLHQTRFLHHSRSNQPASKRGQQ